MGERYRTPDALRVPRDTPVRRYVVPYDGVVLRNDGSAYHYRLHAQVVRAKSAARAAQVVRVRAWFRPQWEPWIHGPILGNVREATPQARTIHAEAALGESEARDDE